MTGFQIFNIAGQGMSAQSVRLNTVASNIANAESASSSDGNTYRARQAVFSAVQVSALDPRLKLPKCSKELSAGLDADLSKPNATIAITCPADVSWTVRLPARIQRFANIVTASQYIPAGEKIVANYLGTIESDISLHSQYYTDPASIIGQTAKSAIPAGQVIKTAQLQATKFVKRGEVVSIIAELPGLKVTSNGTALNDGTLGDSIQVKNMHSKRVIEATVIADHTVRVNL